MKGLEFQIFVNTKFVLWKFKENRISLWAEQCNFWALLQTLYRC